MSPAVSSSTLGDPVLSPAIGALPPPDVFPLSLEQESLWGFEQMVPGTSVYNLPQAWRLRGPLDTEALEHALEALCERHETLRTIFGLRREQPVQIILQRPPLPLERVDISQAPDPEGELARLLSSEARRRFDLSRGPLARFVLFRLDEEDHALLLHLHHLISDEWSFGVLLRELATLYGGARTAQETRLSPLPIQYADFAVWQRSQLAGGSVEEALSFWKGVLHPPLEPVLLPADRPRPALRNFQGATRFFKIDSGLHHALRDLSRVKGVTLFMTLLAAFQTLLHRYCRQTDIVVGSPMSGRERLETEGLIGFFVNTHPLRADFSGDPCFTDLLRRVRDLVLGAVAHQAVSPSRIIQASGAGAGSRLGQLFQTVFGLQPAASEHWDLPGLETNRIELENGGSKFELSVLLYETSDGLRVRCEYSEEILEPATITRLMKHFDTLLKSIVAEPGRRVSEFALLEDSERRQMLGYGEAPASDFAEGGCIHEMFERQAERSPNSIAVVCGQDRLTYGGLNGRASRLAVCLQKLGVGPGVPVALCLERTTELVVAILAVLKAGGAYVPIDPDCPKERLAFMLKDTQAPVLVTQRHLRRVLPPVEAQVLCLEDLIEPVALEPEAPSSAQVKPSDCAYVIYTSGSTGMPKGVQVTHQNVVRLFKQT